MKINYLVAIFIFISTNLFCQWPYNPQTSLPVFIGPGEQTLLSISSDNHNGAIIFWSSWDNKYKIYAQRINENANLLWEKAGQVIDTVENQFASLSAIDDHTGGAVILVNDDLFNIRLIKIDSLGSIKWKLKGQDLFGYVQSFHNSCHIIDTNGNTLILSEIGTSSSSDILLQKVNINGKVLWGNGGIKIAEVKSSFPKIILDNSEGVIVGWRDVGGLLLLQRINKDGNILWNPGGVQVSDNCGVFDMSSDETNGAYVTNTPDHTGSEGITCNRISYSGVILWGNDGILIDTVTYNSGLKSMNDNLGNVIIIYDNNRNTLGVRFLYATKLDKQGNFLWGNNKIKLLPKPAPGEYGINEQTNFSAISDNYSGVITTFEKQDPFYTQSNIYAQSIDKDGNLLWSDSCAAICTALGYQKKPILTNAGKSGAIITWLDDRNNSSNNFMDDIYAQYIDGRGNLGGTITSVKTESRKYLNNFILFQNYPNPFNPKTIINYFVAKTGFVTLKIYDVLGREIETLVNAEKSIGNYKVEFDGSNLSSGI